MARATGRAEGSDDGRPAQGLDTVQEDGAATRSAASTRIRSVEALLGCSDLCKSVVIQRVAGAVTEQPVAMAEAGHLEREQSRVQEGALAAPAALRAVGHLLVEDRSAQGVSCGERLSPKRR